MSEICYRKVSVINMMNRIRKSVAVLFCITTICSFFTSMSISADTSVNTVKYEQTFETNDVTFEANGTTMSFEKDSDGTSCLKVTKPAGTNYWMAARPKSSVLVPIVRANGAGVYRYKAKYKTESGTFNITPVVNIQLSTNKNFVKKDDKQYKISSDKWTEVCFDVVVGEFDKSQLSGVYIGQHVPQIGTAGTCTYYIGYMSFEKVVGYENNLITYGDFEDDQIKLTDYFQANGTTMERVSNGDGTYSLKVTKPVGGEVTAAARPKYETLGTNVKEKGAGIYRYKARYKSESGTFTLKTGLKINNSSNSKILEFKNDVTVKANEWTETCYDFVLSDADDVKYVFVAQQVPDKNTAYTYYIDYMSLEKIGETGENVVSCAKKYVRSDGTEITDIVNYSGDFTVQYTVKNAGGTEVGVAVVTAVKDSVSLKGVDLINDTATADNKVITTKTISKNTGETVDTYCWDNLENMRPWLANE